MFTYFGKSLDEMEKLTIKSSDEGYRLGLFNLPYGGESNKVSIMINLEVCLPEIFLLRLSYLNGGYNESVINKWKSLEYNDTLGSDILYYGMSGYDYIERHLGYRLLIKSISVNYEKYSEYEMKIKLRNVGFGNMLKTKKIDVIYTDMKDKEISRSNVGKYKGELSIEINDQLLSEDYDSDYKVYLSIYSSIESKVIYYPIQFANEKIYNKDLKAHLLFYVKKGNLVEP